ncbi:MAG: CRISPR-associated protein Cas4 [Saprospiraceae bacterium]|nr:CRISPR-associated protein Cas4 [Saprospiraceae bacterium]MCB9322100.1 CRISPR-associated protein Cas4 [Lewinellaceae bacterium]
MHTTGTQISYLHLCPRKLWLFANGLNMEHHSDLVAEGRMIHEHSYPQRAAKWQEIAIEGIKIDHYDAQRRVVREVKKSPKKEEVHIAQLKYYLFVLERNGIEVERGLLEYPKMRSTEEVMLTDADRKIIPQWESEVSRIVHQPDCPPLVKKGICSKCAYYEFCFVEET